MKTKLKAENINNMIDITEKLGGKLNKTQEFLRCILENGQVNVWKSRELGYEVIDQEEMIVEVQSTLATAHPQLHDNLKMIEDFLHELWEEGYFD
jgi:hypothetical protein